MPSEIRALSFDIFGTVVGWRSSSIREGTALGRRLGLPGRAASPLPP